jgi:hypothetical protein
MVKAVPRDDPFLAAVSFGSICPFYFMGGSEFIVIAIAKILVRMRNDTVTSDSDPGSRLDSRLRGNDGLEASRAHSTLRYSFERTFI